MSVCCPQYSAATAAIQLSELLHANDEDSGSSTSLTSLFCNVNKAEKQCSKQKHLNSIYANNIPKHSLILYIIQLIMHDIASVTLPLLYLVIIFLKCNNASNIPVSLHFSLLLKCCEILLKHDLAG